MTDDSAFARVYRFRLGDAEAAVVSDGPLALGAPAEEFSAPSPGVAAESFARHGLPADHTPLEQNALVVRLAGQTVLVDTGTGPSRPFGPDSGRLLASLALAGVAPGDIDAVVLTHVHADHSWGLVGADGPAFPNATVHASGRDVAYWTDEANATNRGRAAIIAKTREVFAHVGERLVRFSDDGEVLPGIRAVAAPGHSVGHTVIRIEAGGAALYALGDLAHHPMQIEMPEIVYRFDNDQVASVASRRRVLAAVAAEGALALGYHYPWPGLGRLRAAGDGWRFEAAAG